MKPVITVLTLAVNDLEKSVAFYQTGLGLPTRGIIGREIENGAVAFFDLDFGLKLALWPRASLSIDTGLPDNTSTSPLGFSMGHNVASKQEVHDVMEQVIKAGGKIVKSATDTFYGGYAGYFADPDNHLWEVSWNANFDQINTMS